jgi:hypothetical protein
MPASWRNGRNGIFDFGLPIFLAKASRVNGFFRGLRYRPILEPRPNHKLAEEIPQYTTINTASITTAITVILSDKYSKAQLKK